MPSLSLFRNVVGSIHIIFGLDLQRCSSYTTSMTKEPFLPLCQPDSGKSCAACCGLYNYVDSSREALTQRLRCRTARFRATVRGPADLAAFSEAIRTMEDQARRFEVIYCCEYVGFLDEAERRVGCLLHPAQNRGQDLRGVSFYGRALCEDHFCPSYHFLTRTEQQILLDLLDDWYLYGLCLTDIDLVKGFFRHLADKLGEMPPPERFHSAAARTAVRSFFAYKLTWPFRSQETNRFGRFYFDGSQHMIRPIDYEGFGAERSRYDGIFLSLTSEFKTGAALHRAEAMVEQNIEALAAACDDPDFR